MSFTRYVFVVTAAAALAACQPTSESGTPAASGPAATTAASPQAAGGGTASGRDDCLTGTWNVDVNDMAKQVAAKIGADATGSGTGTITITFGDTMKIVYANSVMVTKPVANGLMLSVKDDFAGDAVSADWQAKNGTLSGSMSTNTVKTSITAKIGDKEQSAGALPLNGTLDLSQGSISYTCSGTTATLSNPAIDWNLTKS